VEEPDLIAKINKIVFQHRTGLGEKRTRCVLSVLCVVLCEMYAILIQLCVYFVCDDAL
jgi:hypothetical protein